MCAHVCAHVRGYGCEVKVVLIFYYVTVPEYVWLCVCMQVVVCVHACGCVCMRVVVCMHACGCLWKLDSGSALFRPSH